MVAMVLVLFRGGALEAQTVPVAQALPPRPVVGLEFVYSGDLLSPVRGGLRDGPVYVDNLDLKLRFAGARLGLPGLSGLVYVISNRGDDPATYVGDAQGVSNIYADPFWTLFEAWLQQNLFRGRLSVLAGLYDVNSEFDAIQSAGLFLNSSFGTGPDFSQSGRNGPSIFPVASLGVRLKWRPTNWYYVEAAVLDGVPGDPLDPGAVEIELSTADGALVAAEAALFSGPREDAPLTTRLNVRNRSRRIGRGEVAASYSGKLALGGWLYTSRAPALLGGPDLTSRGVYLLGERTVYREPGRDDGLTVFARLGLARAAVNRFGAYGGAGAVYSGPFGRRHDDEVGVAVAVAVNGDPYRDFELAAGRTTDRSETVLELSYRVQVHPRFALQPDVQWVLNPNTDPGRSNTVVLGVRGEASVRIP